MNHLCVSDLSSLSLQPSGASSSSMVKDEYLNRSMEVDGSHSQNIGMGIPNPGVVAGSAHIAPPLQPIQQTIQHHGQPPTPGFSMMGPSHPLQNQAQNNAHPLQNQGQNSSHSLPNQGSSHSLQSQGQSSSHPLQNQGQGITKLFQVQLLYGCHYCFPSKFPAAAFIVSLRFYTRFNWWTRKSVLTVTNLDR